MIFKTPLHQQQETEVNARLPPIINEFEVTFVTHLLRPALLPRGHRVMTVAPRYAAYPDLEDTGLALPLHLPADYTQRPPQEPFHNSFSATIDSSGVGATTPGGVNSSGNPECFSTHARYHKCHCGGVDRVFIEHSIYEAVADDIYGANYTYVDTDSGVPDLDLRWSILSQAAMAAPLLLWLPASDSGVSTLSGQRNTEDYRLLIEEARAAAAEAAQEETNQGEAAMQWQAAALMAFEQQLAADFTPPRHVTHATPPPQPSSPASPSLAQFAAAAQVIEHASRVRDRNTQLIDKESGTQRERPLRNPPVNTIPSVSPVSSPHSARQVPGGVITRHNSPQNGSRSDASQSADMQDVSAPAEGIPGAVGAQSGDCFYEDDIIFVGNDWPCAPLVLRLKHTVEQAQQAQQAQHAASMQQPEPHSQELSTAQSTRDAVADGILSQRAAYDRLSGCATLAANEGHAQWSPALAEKKNSAGDALGAVSGEDEQACQALFREGTLEKGGHTYQQSFWDRVARMLQGARIAFCIHNLAYQGLFDAVSYHITAITHPSQCSSNRSLHHRSLLSPHKSHACSIPAPSRFAGTDTRVWISRFLPLP